MKIENKYIGDGVEASYDGYHIWLKTVDGNDNEIALEPDVLKRLDQYRAYVAKMIELANGGAEDDSHS